MSRDFLVDLLVRAAIRPHSRCLRRTGISACQLRHYALARPGSSKSKQPLDPVLGQRKPSEVPLAVGIDRNPENKSAISRIPIPKGVKGEKFVPSVIERPLGLQTPPQNGQNSPKDTRTWTERKKDFADYERAVERRQILLRTFLRPYFQEWKRTEHFKGKSFVSSDRLFRRDKALYFPNIWGQTLADDQGPDGGKNTTPVLRGKISIVGIQSGQWAEEQVDTFFGTKENPELQDILSQNANTFQRVDINVQGDVGRAWLVKLFSGRLRNSMPEDRWDKYFMVKLPRDIRLGLTDDVRDAMGFLNTQVGYVYLVDENCKIRWAGSGHAWPGEVDNLNSGIKRLLQERTEDSRKPPAIARFQSALVKEKPPRNAAAAA